MLQHGSKISTRQVDYTPNRVMNGVTKNVVCAHQQHKKTRSERRSVAISGTRYRLSGLLFVKLRERGIFRITTLAGFIRRKVRGSRR